MEKTELDKRLAFALQVGMKAGDYLLSHEEMASSVEEKKTNDFVTSADKSVETLILDEIKREFPLDGWFGEESGKGGKETNRWVVDPIDGTVNFMSSFPNYTVSIAFEDEEGYALGVIVCPRQKETFWAVRGGGAFLNGKRIHTHEADDYSRTLALMVPPHRKHCYMDTYISRMMKLYDVFTDARSIGSAALSMCYVASGRCTAYYEMCLYPYDYAAGVVILQEAGGKVRLRSMGDDGVEVTASSAGIHERLLECVSD